MKRKITLYLPNDNFEGLVKITESNGWQFSGQLFSCFRNNLEALLAEKDNLEKNGVYILLSDEKVYIGQTTDLIKRIKQHDGKKDWWDRVIILTSETNSLNASHIIYLESELIKRVKYCKVLECDNNTDGNSIKMNSDDMDLLDDYLNEAYSLLKFLGITAFEKKAKKDSIKSNPKKEIKEAVKSNSLIDSREDALKLLDDNGIEIIGSFSYSKIDNTKKKNYFHLEPLASYLYSDFYLILNNKVEKWIKVLMIPAKSFVYGTVKSKNTLLLRPSNTKRLQMYVKPQTLIDTKSGQDLSKFLVNTINY